MPDPTHTPADPPSPVLPYGRRRRGRRWVGWAVAVAAGISGLATAVVVRPAVRTWSARRVRTRAALAWYQQARTCQVPPGTLLYSDDPADLPPGFGPSAGTRVCVCHADRYAALRQVGYQAEGVPVVYNDAVLFAHERQARPATPGGTGRCVVTVRFDGTDAHGDPLFHTALTTLDSGDGMPFASATATTTAAVPPGRSLSHLRIFAGSPDPSDATAFALPFQCAGGQGRFEFHADDGRGNGLSRTSTSSGTGPRRPPRPPRTARLTDRRGVAAGP